MADSNTSRKMAVRQADAVKGHLTNNERPSRGFPWDDPSVSKHHAKQFPLRLPEDEYAMLKFIGSTTFDESAQSYALRGVRAEIAKELRRRGFVVSLERRTGKLIVKEPDDS